MIMLDSVPRVSALCCTVTWPCTLERLDEEWLTTVARLVSIMFTVMCHVVCALISVLRVALALTSFFACKTVLLCLYSLIYNKMVQSNAF